MRQEVTEVNITLPKGSSSALRTGVSKQMEIRERYADVNVTIGTGNAVIVELGHVPGFYPTGADKEREQKFYEDTVQKIIERLNLS